MSADPTRTALTYRYERLRGFSSGVIETAASTFLLLIAVRHYRAGAISKALVADGGSLGLMLGPWLVSRVATLGWPVAKAAVRISMLGAVSFFMMALFPVQIVFVIGAMLAMASGTGSVPLVTQIYQENYPNDRRGRLVSRAFMIRIGTAVVFAWVAGHAISGHIEYFRWLLVFFGLTFAFASFCLSHVPSRPLAVSGGTHPFRALRYVREDALFRRTLVMWMLMGFGNLMMLPLRVEYLANPKYAITWDNLPLTAAQIALLTSVVPNIARLIMSPIWGWLFDRVNFFVLRMFLNAGFAIGMLSFFGSGSITGMIFAAIVYGIATAGGDVAWSLWVTKFAPPDRVADYMSVHTCFTGLRGVLAPLVAFQLAQHFPIVSISWFGGTLIFLSILVMIPELRAGKRAKFAVPLTEEVSE